MRSENIKGLCISVSATTMTQDVVNPTFKEEELHCAQVQAFVICSSKDYE